MNLFLYIHILKTRFTDGRSFFRLCVNIFGKNIYNIDFNIWLRLPILLLTITLLQF